MASGDTGERVFSVGNVFSRAFAVMRAAPVPVFGASLLLGALPQGVWDYVLPRLTPGLEQQNPDAFFAISMLGIFFAMALLTLAQAALVPVAIAHSEGRSASLGQGVHVTFAAILPLLGLSIVTTAAIIAGILLLVVPGLILLVVWSVATPALVGERCGISSALRRSRDLTEGVRWQVFALILFIIVFAVGFAFVMERFAIPFGIDPDILDGWHAVPFGFSIFRMVLSIPLDSFASMLSVSLYVELCMWKDGLSADRLAEVFE